MAEMGGILCLLLVFGKLTLGRFGQGGLLQFPNFGGSCFTTVKSSSCYVDKSVTKKSDLNQAAFVRVKRSKLEPC